MVVEFEFYDFCYYLAQFLSGENGCKLGVVVLAVVYAAVNICRGGRVSVSVYCLLAGQL